MYSLTLRIIFSYLLLLTKHLDQTSERLSNYVAKQFLRVNSII
jgi:hypothetical protein